MAVVLHLLHLLLLIMLLTHTTVSLGLLVKMDFELSQYTLAAKGSSPASFLLDGEIFSEPIYMVLYVHHGLNVYSMHGLTNDTAAHWCNALTSLCRFVWASVDVHPVLGAGICSCLRVLRQANIYIHVQFLK
jgi:hypothetical protein